jgi:hypothetical protein
MEILRGCRRSNIKYLLKSQGVAAYGKVANGRMSRSDRAVGPTCGSKHYICKLMIDFFGRSP